MRSLRLRALSLLSLLLACGEDPAGESGPGTSSTSSTGTTTSSSTSSSGDPSEGGFIDTSSSTTSAESTGPACTEDDMCMSLGDCELGECVDCTCVFDYGPCAGGECTCFVPSVAECFEGGCFCTLPCIVDEPNPCPIPPSGTSAPVCAMEEFAGECGLPCAGEGEPGCPDGMTCIARPDDQPMWGDFICVFP